jgi:hypothetical protein
VLRKEGSPVNARDALRSSWSCEIWTFSGRPRGAVESLVLSTRPFKCGAKAAPWWGKAGMLCGRLRSCDACGN